MTFHPDENRSPSSSPSAEGGARLSGREQTATPAELREALLKIDEHNSPLLALDRKSGGLKEKLISYAQKALECLEKLCHLATNFEDALAKPDTSAEDLKKIQERSAEALKELSDQIKEIPRVERERYRYDPTIGKFIERTSEAISDASAKLDTDLPPEILHRARIEDMARVRKLAKDFLESHRLEERRAESDETINGLIDAIEKATANPPRVDFAPFNEAVQIAKAQDAARSGSRGVNQRFVSECLKNFKEQLDQADPELAINVSRFSHLIRECRREILAAAINADRAEAPTQSLSREKAEEAVEILKQGKIREGFNLALADHPQDAVLGFNVSHHPETGELRVGRPITKSAIQRNKNEVLKSFAYSKALLADEQFDDRSRELLDGWLGTGNDSIEHQIKLMREKADGLQTVDNELGGILLYSCTRMSRGLKELRDAYEKRKQEALAQPVAEPSKVPVENKTEQSVPDSSTQVTTEPSPASTPERIVSHFETQVTSKVTELLDGIDVSDRHSDFVSDFGRLAREVEKSEDRDGAREFVEYAVRELREVLPAERQAEAGVLLNNFRQKLGLPTINERSNSAPGEGAPQAEYRPATSVGDDSGDARQDVEAQENGAKDASPSVPATAAAGVEAPLETSAVDTKVPGAVDPVVVGVEGSSPDAAQERTYRFQHEFADELLRHALGETATPRSPEIKSELLFRVDRAPGAKGKGQKIHRERFEEWVAKAREEIQKSTPPKQHARRLAALDEFVEQVKPAIYEGKAVAISPLGRLRMEAVSLRLRAQDTVQASFQRKEGRLPPEARSSELALSASVIRVCRAMERSSEIGKADAKALFDGAQDRLIAMVEAIPQTQRGDQGVRIGRRLDRLERAYDQWFEANQKRAEEIRAQRAADRQQGPASQTSVESVAEAGAVNPGDSGEVGAPEATSPQGPAGEIEVDRGATGDERNPEDSAQVGTDGTFPEEPESATTGASGADSSGVSPEVSPGSAADLSARSNFERFVEFRRVGTELRVRLTSPFDENSKVVFRVNPAAEERLRQELQVLSNGESDLCFSQEGGKQMLLAESEVFKFLQKESRGQISRIENLRVRGVKGEQLVLNVSGGVLENVVFDADEIDSLRLLGQRALLREVEFNRLSGKGQLPAVSLKLTHSCIEGGRIFECNLSDTNLNGVRIVGATVASNQFGKSCSAKGIRIGEMFAEDGKVVPAKFIGNSGELSCKDAARETSTRLRKDDETRLANATLLENGTVQIEIDKLVGREERKADVEEGGKEDSEIGEAEAAAAKEEGKDSEKTESPEAKAAREFHENITFSKLGDQVAVIFGGKTEGAPRVIIILPKGQDQLSFQNEFQGAFLKDGFDLFKDGSLNNDSAILAEIEKLAVGKKAKFFELSHLNIEGKDLTDWDLSRAQLIAIRISNCTGSNVKFDSSVLQEFVAEGNTFTNLSAKGARVYRGTIRNNTFKNSTFDELTVLEAFVAGNTFSDCTAQNTRVGKFGDKPSSFDSNLYEGEEGFDLKEAAKNFQYEKGTNFENDKLGEVGKEIPSGVIENELREEERQRQGQEVEAGRPDFRKRSYLAPDQQFGLTFTRTEPKVREGARSSATLVWKEATNWQRDPQSGIYRRTKVNMPFLDIVGHGPLAGAKMMIPIEPAVMMRELSRDLGVHLSDESSVAGNLQYLLEKFGPAPIQEYLQRKTEGLEQIFQPNTFRRGKDGRPQDAGFRVSASLNTNCQAFHQLLDISDRSITQLKGVKVNNGNLAGVHFGRIELERRGEDGSLEPVVENCVFKNTDMQRVRFSRYCERDFAQGGFHRDTPSVPRPTFIRNFKMIGCRGESVDARRCHFEGKVRIEGNTFYNANFNLADIGYGTFKKNVCTGPSFQLTAHCIECQKGNHNHKWRNGIRKHLIAKWKFRGTKFAEGAFGENEKYLPVKERPEEYHDHRNAGNSIAFFKAGGFDQPNYANMQVLPNSDHPVCGAIEGSVEREVAFYRSDDNPPKRLVLSYLGAGDLAERVVMTVQRKERGFWVEDSYGMPAELQGQVIKPRHAELHVIRWLRSGWYPLKKRELQQEQEVFRPDVDDDASEKKKNSSDGGERSDKKRAQRKKREERDGDREEED